MERKLDTPVKLSAQDATLPTMPVSLPPSKADIAERAYELKIVFLALSASLMTILDPSLPVLQVMLARLDATPDEDIPMDLGHGEIQPGGEVLSFSMRQVLTSAAALQGGVVRDDLMAIGMMQGGIRVGDMIRRGGYLHRTDVPLIQFAKHFRNACAHGDRWNFERGQPKHSAGCRGVRVTKQLEGQRATMAIVTPRLYVEFLDDIANHFVPGRVPAPGRGA
jgi:hypothetical protein